MEFWKQEVGGSSPVSSTINLGLKCHIPRYDVIENKPLVHQFVHQLAFFWSNKSHFMTYLFYKKLNCHAYLYYPIYKSSAIPLMPPCDTISKEVKYEEVNCSNNNINDINCLWY